ncbi:unnamed protein product [Rotaria magnacalcarata]|uniref:Glutamine amidotransferase type-2 domain-containing protein n=1 Tax=Rotaria magnacalcarata TaxID=392030 RepID=A0A819JJQ8_9BILA|nr:unnamed protein product [Rotaria magnacalcarata]
MCGICFCLHTQLIPLSIDYKPLNARGPDFQTQHGPISLTSNLYVTFAVSVLALRGYKQQQQPFIDEDGNILLFNGEIYEGTLQISADDNDGVVLSQHLKQCSTDIDICNLISALEGCFAFIYFQKKTNSLYYGRDRLGRRSLLYSTETDPQSNIKMILSSVQLNNLSYSELDSNILHKLTVIEADHTYRIDFIPYVNHSIDRIIHAPPDILLNELESNSEFQNASKTFLNQLQNAVQRRVINIPSLCRQCKQFADSILRPLNGCQHAKLAILFSGGIDSTVLASLVDRVLPINEPIDLLNVAFFSAVSAPPADRQTGNICIILSQQVKVGNFFRSKLFSDRDPANWNQKSR